MLGSLSVLGIPVGDDQLDRWLAYWAPSRRPFPASELPVEVVEGRSEADLEHADEWRDTFFLYSGGPWVWLSEQECLGLPPALRGRLAAGLRRRTAPKPALAWPDDPMLVAKMLRWIEAGTRPSLHALAQGELRAASAGPLPGAMELAGTFPHRSGANCFGTVMAAAGEPVAAEWVQLEQFETWLAGSGEPVKGSRWDRESGVVLTWHEQGVLAHAAVTIGGGWALQKPSQSWSSPVIVQPVVEIIRAWNYPGTVLARHLLQRK